MAEAKPKANAKAFDGVCVAYVPKGAPAIEIELPATAGLTVLEAVRASGLAQHCPEISASDVSYGIWGKLREAGDVVVAGDRVEIYRPLVADPKVSRRRRVQKKAAAK